MENITIYIKQLSGDIIPINFKPDASIRNVNLIFKVHSLFPEYPLERILLFHNDFIDLSEIKDQDTVNLFICDPYKEKITCSLSLYKNYERYDVNIYDNSLNYFYNKERKASICIYIFMRLKDKYFKVSEEKCDEYDEYDEWFPNLYNALFEFQKDYNNIKKHSSFTDEKLIYIYHLWNIKKIN